MNELVDRNKIYEEIDCTAKCVAILYSKESFVIAKFERVKGEAPRTFSVKGNYLVELGKEFNIKGINAGDKNYPDSFNPIAFSQFKDLMTASSKEQEEFLGMILSKAKIKALYEVSDNPIKMLEEADIEKLMEAEGIGLATAEKLIESYENQKDFSSAYISFAKYKLSMDQVKKICKSLGGIEQAIMMVEADPFVLTQIPGYGFKRADAVFLNNPENKPNDKRRIKAYIKYLFEELHSEGHTWITAKDFVGKVKENIFNADVKWAVEHVKTSVNYVVYRLDKELRITTSFALATELAVCDEINRLLNSDNKNLKRLVDSAKIIKHVQKAQGWKFSEEQQKSIKMMIAKNVFLLQGYGGTGKSSSLNGFLSIVNDAGMTYKQGALSGKAANNMFLITGKEATTLHSMLVVDPINGGFVYNKDNKMLVDVIVIDEMSMVDIFMFLDVLKATPDGAKLIMLGDMGQLESIGVGIMAGLIKTGKMPSQLLTQIHRQAQKSAIITHSIAIRNGVKPTELKFDIGSKIYGENQDLEYIFVDPKDEDQISRHVMLNFRKLIEKHDINDVQILCSTKATGKTSTWDLNKFAQRVLINKGVLDGEYITIKRKGYKKPKSDSDIKLNRDGADEDSCYFVHVGEKVINMRNNKKMYDVHGNPCPIFNGNTGTVKQIIHTDKQDILVIDFEGIGIVNVLESHFEHIELGYAITVHKSQGSTIKYVIFALPFHYLLNTRELLYTGMTRASEYLILITSPRSFKKAVKQTFVKEKRTNFSDLFTRLKDFDLSNSSNSKFKKLSD